MAESTRYLFDYKEVVEALIKRQGLHEGLWGLGIEFGFGVQNVNTPNGLAPAAIIPVQKIGLNKWQEPNNLTVDAAEVNPLSKQAGKGAKKAGSKKKAVKK